MKLVSLKPRSFFNKLVTFATPLIIKISNREKDMITMLSFPIILIIFQELHDEPLKRKVNDVNQKTRKRKTFVRRSVTIIKVLFVLGERKQLSFKTLSAYL